MSENVDENDSEEAIFDKIDQTYDFNANNIIEIRDSLFARKDNIVIFLTENGEPCDDSSRLLAKNKESPIIRDATLRRARVIKQGRQHIIALVTKIRASILTGLIALKGQF
jgi:hypothetical protein